MPFPSGSLGTIRESHMDYCILIIILMIVAGLLGGITNNFRNEREEKNKLLLLKNISMGICASFMTPLFLNMISSNLLKEGALDNLKLFVLFGFFLIASLSSKVFIETLSARVLSQLERNLEDVKKKEEVLSGKEREPEEAEETNLFLKGRGFDLDDNVKKVLTALGSGKYAWRTLRGIAKEIEIPKETVLNSLNWLSSNGLAVTGEKGRWALTLEGRDVFAGMSSAQNSKQE